MKAKRHTVVTIVAALHLLLAAAGAAHLSLLSDKSSAGLALHAYRELTGANNNFGFFAPSVASQVTAKFELKDAAGSLIAKDTLEGNNSESNLRIHTMLLFFTVSEAQDLLARSWAAMMFGRHPDAAEVVVRVSIYDLPTMSGYRSGRRPSWSEIYVGNFVRRTYAGNDDDHRQK